MVGSGRFNTRRDALGVALEAGTEFAQPKIGRGLAYGDFDRDGDLDILMTTNSGPALLFRNDQLTGNHSVRFHLTGTKSNRGGIGARVRIVCAGVGPVAHGKEQLQLFVAVRDAPHLRPGKARPS